MHETYYRLVSIMFVQVTEKAEKNKEIPVVACHLEEDRESISKHFKQFHGELLEIRTGEIFACFPGATLALDAAVSLQKKLSRFNLRIGLHVGEGLFRNGRLLGADVNLASRLPDCARAGGICLSRTVYQYLKKSEREKLVALGPHDLKNFNIRMPLYAYLPDGQSRRNRGREMRRRLLVRLNKFWQIRSVRVAIFVGLVIFLIFLLWAKNLTFSTPERAFIRLYIPAFVSKSKNNEIVDLEIDSTEMAIRSSLSGRHRAFDLVLAGAREQAIAELQIMMNHKSGRFEIEYILRRLPAGRLLVTGRLEQNDFSLFQLQDRLSERILQEMDKPQVKASLLASDQAGAKLSE